MTRVSKRPHSAAVFVAAAASVVFLVSGITSVLSGQATAALPTVVVDNADKGFRTGAYWYKHNSNGAYKKTVANGTMMHLFNRNIKPIYATWTAQLKKGTYDVQITWQPVERLTDAAAVTVEGGKTKLTAVLNQKKAPTGTAEGTVTWQSLGTVELQSNRNIVVRMEAPGREQYTDWVRRGIQMQADAVRFVPRETPRITLGVAGPEAQTYAPGEDAVLANVTMQSGNEAVLVESLHVLTEGMGQTAAMLRNIATGMVVNGEVAGDGMAGGTPLTVYRFPNITVQGATTWELRTVIPGDAAGRVRAHVCSDTVKCTFGGVTEPNTAYAMKAKGLQSGIPATSTVGGTVSGNVHTVGSAELFTAVKGGVAQDIAVKNQKDVVLLRFEARASAAAPVLLTQAQFVAGNGSLLNAQNYALWVDTDADGSVDTPVERGVGATQDGVTFGNLEGGGYVIPAEGTVAFEVRADIAASLVNDTLQLLPHPSQPFAAENADNGAALGATEINGDCPADRCDIHHFDAGQTVTTYRLTAQGNLYVTKDTAPLRSRQLLGGTLGDTVLQLSLRAENEDIDVTDLQFTSFGSTATSVERLELYLLGATAPFATATTGGCGSDRVPTVDFNGAPAQTFCANMEGRQLVVPEGDRVGVQVLPRMKSDTAGATAGQVIGLFLSESEANNQTTGEGAVRARGVLSSSTLAGNNGNATAEGEVLIGTDRPAPNTRITGNANQAVLAKAVSITNANPDPDNSSLPTGITPFGQFRFTAAPNANTLNGLNKWTLDAIIFDITAANVELDSQSLRFYNKADTSVKRQCTVLNPQGAPIGGPGIGVSGALYAVCDNLKEDAVATELSSGESAVFVLEASITRPTMAPGGATLQASITSFTDIARNDSFGWNASHIKWFDEDATVLATLRWLDLAETAVRSTVYQITGAGSSNSSVASVSSASSTAAGCGAMQLHADKPWQNKPLAQDVDNNGRVDSFDFLSLSQFRSTQQDPLAPLPLPRPADATLFVDVNGDGLLSGLDFLAVANYMSNRCGASSSSSSRSSAPGSCTSTNDCPAGMRCSTEWSDCFSNCLPGMACPDVCTGRCMYVDVSSSSRSSAANTATDFGVSLDPDSPNGILPQGNITMKAAVYNNGPVSAITRVVVAFAVGENAVIAPAPLDPRCRLEHNRRLVCTIPPEQLPLNQGPQYLRFAVAPRSTNWCNEEIVVRGRLEETPQGDLNSENTESQSVLRVPCTSACSDAIDNDADGIIDYPFDGGCSSASDNSEQDVLLESVSIDSCDVTVLFSGAFDACPHMLDGQGTVHVQNLFCAQDGRPVVRPLSDFAPRFTGGLPVKLCHGNNYGNCSNQVTVTQRGTCGTTGNLYVSKDTQPVMSRQMLGGTLTAPLLHLSLRADTAEDLDVTGIRITATGQNSGSTPDILRSVDRMELYLPGAVTAFAVASTSGCGSTPVPPNTMCANMPNSQLQIPAGTRTTVTVRARIKPDAAGGMRNDFLTLGLPDGGAVTARGMRTNNLLVANDGDATAEGEVFIGTDWTAANAPITGVKHQTVMAKIANITNANPDADGTSVPTGIAPLGQFRFTTSPNTNTLNGLNKAELRTVIFNVNAPGVIMNARGFKAYNKADASWKKVCAVLDRAGVPVPDGVVEGSFPLLCDFSDSGVNATIDPGTSLIMVVEAEVVNKNSGASIQVSLQQFHDINLNGTFGPAQSHMEWADRDIDGIAYQWIESGNTIVNSTLYRD